MCFKFGIYCTHVLRRNRSCLEIATSNTFIMWGLCVPCRSNRSLYLSISNKAFKTRNQILLVMALICLNEQTTSYSRVLSVMLSFLIAYLIMTLFVPTWMFTSTGWFIGKFSIHSWGMQLFCRLLIFSALGCELFVLGISILDSQLFYARAMCLLTLMEKCKITTFNHIRWSGTSIVVFLLFSWLW